MSNNFISDNSVCFSNGTLVEMRKSNEILKNADHHKHVTSYSAGYT